MRQTGLSSGSVYPILAKLRKHGWVAVGTEGIDPHIAGRPARTFYKIAGAAVPAARSQLAALSERRVSTDIRNGSAAYLVITLGEG